MAIAQCYSRLKLRFAWRSMPLIEFLLELVRKQVQHRAHHLHSGSYSMRLKQAALAVSLAALALTGGCKKVDGDNSAVTANDGSEWGGFVETFLEGYFKVMMV